MMSHDDFDLESLAAYLHLTPAQVSRMADRGKLPGRKIGGSWKFTQAEIHHWLEDRIGASDEGELLQVEEVLDREAGDRADEAVSIAEMLPVEAIAAPLPARTRSSVISSMAQLAAATGLLWDAAKMADAVSARENLHPTALDNGVALLHPRRPLSNILAEPFLALGRTQQGIPFGHSGGALTDIFFLICSTDDRGHLRVLARLSRVIADPSLLAFIRESTDPSAIRQAIAECEQRLESG